MSRPTLSKKQRDASSHKRHKISPLPDLQDEVSLPEFHISLVPLLDESEFQKLRLRVLWAIRKMRVAQELYAEKYVAHFGKTEEDYKAAEAAAIEAVEQFRLRQSVENVEAVEKASIKFRTLVNAELSRNAELFSRNAELSREEAVSFADSVLE